MKRMPLRSGGGVLFFAVFRSISSPTQRASTYPQVPPKVEYLLTAKGKSLLPLLLQMREWGCEHRQAVETNR